MSTNSPFTFTPHGPVVTGLDGSAPAFAAARLAAWEASRRGEPLLLVHGYANAIPQETFGWSATAPGATQIAIANAQTMIDAAAIRLRHEFPGLDIRSSINALSPAAAILEHAEQASLVVVGSRGGGGFAGMVMGSVAQQVAVHAHRPVIVVRPRRIPGTGRTEDLPVPTDEPVVVGVDGSATAHTAVGFAFEQASSRGVDLVALYAWWLLPRGNLGPVVPGQADLSEAPAEADRMLAEAVAGWSEKYPDVVVRRHPVHDMNPTEALVDASLSAGLIVVGCRGRGGFARLLLGSTSLGLVGHAQSPVAVVHNHECG